MVLPNHQVVVALALGTVDALERFGLSEGLNEGACELIANAVLGGG